MRQRYFRAPVFVVIFFITLQICNLVLSYFISKLNPDRASKTSLGATLINNIPISALAFGPYLVVYIGISMRWEQFGIIRRSIGRLCIIVVLISTVLETQILIEQLNDSLIGKPWQIHGNIQILFVSLGQLQLTVAVSIVLLFPIERAFIARK